VILLLDNFETLIDPESLSLRDSELSDALNALLGGQHHAVKVVITTRIAPRDLAISEPGRQHHLSLDEGLESPYAENVLREMDADGRVGLKSAPDALLNKAREKTRGYPRALEALYAILSVDRYTTLEELLELSLPDEVVQKLVGEAFNRLDPSAQKVMQALAVYNRPVSPAAIDYLLQPHLPSIDSALALNRLVSMHFARREAGRYYLHPADKEYAFSIIPEKDLTTKGTKVTKEEQGDSSQLPITNYQSLFTQHDLLNRAADFFAQARKPRAEWNKLDDLNAQLAEFELRYEADDYDTAASVLLEIDTEYLSRWGHCHLMIDLHEKLQGKINDLTLARVSIGNLGQALSNIGKYKQAIFNYEKALSMAREAKNRQAEGAWLGNIGNIYVYLGDISTAVAYKKQSLAIDREIGDRDGEANSLNWLGVCSSSLGQFEVALKYYEQSLKIAEEVQNKSEEGWPLSNIGECHFILGNLNRSIEYFMRAKTIFKEIGYRRGEAICIGNIGDVLSLLGDYKKAEENYKYAIEIADEILNPPAQQGTRYGLAGAHLFQNDLVNARAAIEAALQYDVPRNNYNATALHGIIALRQGERETAQEAFAKSIAQADEILAKTPDYYEALDAKGLSNCGLTICDLRLKIEGREELLAEAMETFRKARKIAPHAGVVKSVLRLFDELVKCDEEGILKGVRDAAEGK
jgi:tetratricopeptide (TPR) repeat protein